MDHSTMDHSTMDHGRLRHDPRPPRARAPERAATLLLALLLAAAGAVSLRQLPMDALPDLSEVQVIVKAQFPGQSPRDVEDQLTYPLSASLLAVPGVKDVRAFSFYGDAFLYALFEEGTDPYWARSRVGEVLAEAQSRLPPSATASLGPDASALGWVLAYAWWMKQGSKTSRPFAAFQRNSCATNSKACRALPTLQSWAAMRTSWR